MGFLIPDSIFEQADDHAVFEDVCFYLLRFFGNQIPDSHVIESRSDIPESAKTAWYLWPFFLEVSSSGIPDYLLNHCPPIEQLILTHRALQVVQASELLALFEAAIPATKDIARIQGQFSVFPCHTWIDQFMPDPQWPDLEHIAVRSLTLATAPFCTLVANYLRENRFKLAPPNSKC